MTIFGYVYPRPLWQYHLHMGQAHGNVQKCTGMSHFRLHFQCIRSSHLIMFLIYKKLIGTAQHITGFAR